MKTIVDELAAAGMSQAGGVDDEGLPADTARYVFGILACWRGCSMEAALVAVGDVDCTSLPPLTSVLKIASESRPASAPVRQPSSAPQRTATTPVEAGFVAASDGSAAT